MATHVTDGARDLRDAIEQRLEALADKPGDPRAALLGHLLDTLDFEGFRRLQARHLEDPKTGREAKFLDLVYWIDGKFKLITAFGLHRAAPRRIVDIGAGNGLFAVICRFYGHEVLCTDTGTMPLYNDMTAFFGLDCLVHRVEPFTPLDFGRGRFNLATAMMTTFNRRPSPWGAAEWDHFFADLADNELAEGSEIIVKMGLRYFSPELSRHFRALGAEVRDKQGYVRFAGVAPGRFAEPASPARRQAAPDGGAGLAR